MNGVLPNIEDNRVVLIKGWFQDTLRHFLRGFSLQGRLVIHIDCDLHSATLFVLTVIDPLISEGTVVMFDEFISAPTHEFRAFQEYLCAYRRNAELLCMTKERDNDNRAAFVFRG